VKEVGGDDSSWATYWATVRFEFCISLYTSRRMAGIEKL
jgi:hypothetical protein